MMTKLFQQYVYLSLRDVKKKVQIVKRFFAIAVWLTSGLYGLESGWTGPALKILTSTNSPFLLNSNDITLLSISATAANILSILVCCYFARYFGRKPLLIICCGILAVSWLMNCFANTLALLILSKIMIKVGLGVFDVLNCIYISEITSARNRGIFVAVSLIFYTMGEEFQYLIGLLENYVMLSFIPFMVAILTLFMFYFTCESPHFLIMSGRREEAWRILYMLEGAENHVVISEKYNEIVRYVEEDKKDMNFMKFMLQPENYYICLCLLVTNSLVYLNAIQTFRSYEPVIMRPFSSLNTDLVLNLLGVGNVIATLVSPIFVDKFGRKFLMFGGFLSMAFVQGFASICFFVEQAFDSKIPVLPELICGSIIIEIVIFAVSLFPVTHVLRSEMLPHKVKESGSTVVVIFKALMSGFASGMFFPIADRFGVGFVFGFYAVVAFYAAYYVHMHLKETKSMSLAEIRNWYMSR